jgi:hypothetical protein
MHKHQLGRCGQWVCGDHSRVVFTGLLHVYTFDVESLSVCNGMCDRLCAIVGASPGIDRSALDPRAFLNTVVAPQSASASLYASELSAASYPKHAFQSGGIVNSSSGDRACAPHGLFRSRPCRRGAKVE